MCKVLTSHPTSSIPEISPTLKTPKKALHLTIEITLTLLHVLMKNTHLDTEATTSQMSVDSMDNQLFIRNIYNKY